MQQRYWITDLGLGLAVLAVGTLGAFVADRLGMPAGTMVGALVATGIYRLAGGRTGAWQFRYGRAGRLLLGVVIGGAFGPDVVVSLKAALFPVLALIIIIVCVGLFLGWALSRVTKLDRATALLSIMPGGLPAMVSMSDDVGADVTVVATVHFVRLTTVLLATPVVMPLLIGSNMRAVGAAALPMATSLDLWMTLAALACGLAGGLIGILARVPSGDLIGSMVAVSVANLSGAGLGPLASEFRIVAMVLIGVAVGAQMSLESLRRLREIVLPVAASIIALIVAGVSLGWLLWMVTSLDLATALLSAVPGGAGTMPAIAYDLGGDMRLVAAFHLTRQLVLVLVLLPILGRTLLRGGLRARGSIISH